jgi:hypothetical protein
LFKRGLIFDRGSVFKGFVNYFYKVKSAKKVSKRFFYRVLGKLILNSLYGRFGMKYFEDEVSLASKMEEIIFKDSLGLQFCQNLGYGIFLVKYKAFSFENECNSNKLRKKYKGIFRQKNIAVHIAAAITSYSRIEIYKYKNLLNNTAYYSDTDSVYLEFKLNKNLLVNKMGYMSPITEKVVECFFIANKFYGYKTINSLKEVQFSFKTRGFNSSYFSIKDYMFLYKGGIIRH